MYPPIYALANASAPVKAVFGATPRVFLFGLAPQPGQPAFAKPYAVWQTPINTPENYLGDRCDADNPTVQMDVYADTASAARNGLEVLRTLYEEYGYITSIQEWPREIDTLLYRASMDIEFWVYR